MEENPEVKYMVLLGEVGGTEEYKVIEAIKSGKITKPVIAWCIGTIAEHFSTGVQFGHAGASANAERETAVYKNKAMREAGIFVPDSFNDLPDTINSVFKSLNIAEIVEPELKIVPKIRRKKSLSVQFLTTEATKQLMLVSQFQVLQLLILEKVSAMLSHFFGSKNSIQLGQLNLSKLL